MVEGSGLVDITPSGPAPAIRPATRPWMRYWARMIDNLSFGLAIGLVAGIVWPDLAGLPGPILNVLGIAAWMPVEAALLSSFGTTGGKWLLRVKVARRDSQASLDFSTTFQRSFSVWWRGMGVGIPIVTLITLAMSHGRLTNQGVTKWDEDGGFDVSHEDVGIVRGIAAAAIIIGGAFVVVAAQMSDRGGVR